MSMMFRILPPLDLSRGRFVGRVQSSPGLGTWPLPIPHGHAVKLSFSPYRNKSVRKTVVRTHKTKYFIHKEAVIIKILLNGTRMRNLYNNNGREKTPQETLPAKQTDKV